MTSLNVKEAEVKTDTSGSACLQVSETDSAPTSGRLNSQGSHSLTVASTTKSSTTKANAAKASGVVSGTTRSARGRLFTWPLALGLLVTAGLITASLLVGVYDIFGADDGLQMFFITRVPRTVSLILAGAGLAMAGLIMQLITQNRFVEPTTVGTTEWAGLGLLFALIITPAAPIWLKMLLAIIFAFAGTMIFFAFLRKVTLRSSIIVPIVGMMLGSVVGAFSTLIALSTDLSQTMTIWFTGTFSTTIQGQYEPLWFLVFVVIAIFICADRFTVAGLGEDVATNVGLNYRAVVLIGNFLIAMVAGIVTVVVGNLPFLGLIVPNLVAMFRGDDLRSNLPWVALGGIWVVTICDLIGRTVIMPYEIPASSILALVGAIIFIILLLKQRRKQR